MRKSTLRDRRTSAVRSVKDALSPTTPRPPFLPLRTNCASVVAPLETSYCVSHILLVLFEGIEPTTSGEGESLIRKRHVATRCIQNRDACPLTPRMPAHTAAATLTRSPHPRSAQEVQAGRPPTGSRRSQGACRIAFDRAMRLPAGTSRHSGLCQSKDQGAVRFLVFRLAPPPFRTYAPQHGRSLRGLGARRGPPRPCPRQGRATPHRRHCGR